MPRPTGAEPPHELHPGSTPDAAALPEFETLVRRHQAMVFSLAYHFLQDRGRAEEVTQDVFFSLYRNRETLTSGAHAIFWLRKVASQRALDAARRRRRWWFDKPLESAAEPVAAANFEDTLRDQTLWKMVGRLSEVPRMIVILRYQEDLGPSEIAEAMALPLATVKSHLQRSLALLRQKLGNQWGGSL